MTAFLDQYGAPIQQGAALAGSTIGALAPNKGGAAASGALKGAAAGMAFGPVGAGVGAVVGGITSFIGAKKEEKALEEMKRKQENADNLLAVNTGVANAGRSLKHGGKLLSKKLNPLAGGGLNVVSDDAVEVKANNPNETDSVELQEAAAGDKEEQLVNRTIIATPE